MTTNERRLLRYHNVIFEKQANGAHIYGDGSMNYSDTYTGIRWTYGSKLRPFLSLFGYFDGWILFSDEQHPDFPTFGTMQTSKPIPPATAKRWDLILIKEE